MDDASRSSWLVYRLNGSALLLGLVGFSGQIPNFLLAPFAGVLLDRLDRRKLLVWTRALAAAPRHVRCCESVSHGRL